VWINDHLTLASEMPHGGFKQSGYGKDMSSYSIEDYTVVKHVMAKIADRGPMEWMQNDDRPGLAGATAAARVADSNAGGGPGAGPVR